MPDPELQWIPYETTQAVPIRTRVIGIIVFAATFLAIGFGVGRLTAGIPAGAQSEAIRWPSADKPTQPPVGEPSAARKSNNPPAQRPLSSSPLGTKEAASPPVVLNHSSAEKRAD
jgi:hypothetical protein